MRKWLYGLVVALGAAIAYSLPPTSHAQTDAPLFVSGETIRLITDSGRREVTCFVTQQRGHFLGCRNDILKGGTGGETLYNLRFVTEAYRAER